MSVTVNEAVTVGAASTSVTTPMPCYNDQLFFSPDYGGCWYQRWFDVHVWRDDQGRAFAQPDGFTSDEPWRVRVERCFCGRPFATRGPRIWRCRECERAQRATRQRARRAGRQVLAATCAHGAGAVSAKRASRSTAVRAVALRPSGGVVLQRNSLRTTCPDNPGHVRTDNPPLYRGLSGCPSGVRRDTGS
jgi:hypothetical protein